MVDISLERGELPVAGTVVVLATPTGMLSAAAARLDVAARALLTRALSTGSLKHGRILHLAFPAGLELDAILVLVAGKAGPLTALEVEELGGKLVQKLKALGIAQATVASSVGVDLGLPPAAIAAHLAAGARLRAYGFERYKSAGKDEEAPEPKLTAIRFLSDSPDGALALRLEAVAEAACAARDLVSEPANVLTPAALAEACRGLAEFGVEVEVLEQAELERLGMRALLGVAQGSAQPPFVVVMRWRGADAEAPLALVGKGVCFDTGGISLKPGAGMEDMKFDMGGAAAVYGTMRALARRTAAADVVGVVGLVENMPSGTAQRPGDVVRAMSGTTIEVINTDAEGRLVLADVLWYTQDRFKPAAIVDLATLTGACLVALGHENAGLFANDDTLASRLTEAGAAVGEGLWRLPIGPAYAKHIESAIADIKNVGRAREAGASAGAVFLERFVNGRPWAHLDIAGTAWSARDLPLSPKGATGFGVRLLERLVADHYETGRA
ncbi:MAG: leucyl aminopeptidase [Geminicoccaceae bacterium]